MTLLKNLAAAFVLGFSLNAFAGMGFSEYSDQKFAAAQKEGKPILLDFYASWCPTCKKQGKVLGPLLKDKKYAGVVALKVDYDNAASLKKKMNVSKQSTLIVFKGNEEKGRGLGITSKSAIGDLLDKAL